MANMPKQNRVIKHKKTKHHLRVQGARCNTNNFQMYGSFKLQVQQHVSLIKLLFQL